MNDTSKRGIGLEDFAGLVPEELLERSGSVFYSGREAFEGASDLYVLGSNPGGDPDVQRDETVRAHVDKVLHNVPDNWSEYRDERWAGRPPGMHGIQPGMLHMFRRLELDAGRVPSSNVLFVRSKNEQSLAGDYRELAGRCWAVHAAVIEKLCVSVILCLGKTAGRWVCGQVGAEPCIDVFYEQNDRGWSSRTYANPDGLNVVVVTHPGRADWTNPAADPTELVRRALDRGRSGRRR